VHGSKSLRIPNIAVFALRRMRLRPCRDSL
jgi:hypothetical protein